MELELEGKFLNIDIEAIREKLADAGATLVTPMRLMRRAIIKTDEMIARKAFARVRDEGDKVTMTFKQISDNKADYNESEIVVSDFDSAIEILTRCGIPQKSYQESKREEWTLDGVQICIDEWPWANPYIEIEGDNEETLVNVAKKLGYNWADAKRGSVWSVYWDSYPHFDGEMRDVENFRFGDPLPDSWKA